jgi:hypothetical protein
LCVNELICHLNKTIIIRRRISWKEAKMRENMSERS